MWFNKKCAPVLVSMFLSSALTACSADTAEEGARSSGGENTATVTIAGKKHEFSNPDCFSGFNNDLGTLLVNDEVHFEASQLDPAQNTWTIQYNIPLGDRKFEKYSTIKHDTKRSGNRITGTASAEKSKSPGSPIDISYDITCEDG